MGETVQKAVGGVGGGTAGVVAHAHREDRVLARGHGHTGAGGDLQHDQAEAGGDGVGDAREGGVLAVAAQEFGVLDVPRGQQLGLEPEGDETGGVGGVRGGDGARGGRGGVRAAAALGGVVTHGVRLLAGAVRACRRGVWGATRGGVGWARARVPGHRGGTGPDGVMYAGCGRVRPDLAPDPAPDLA